jgi:hypothetical protein
MKSLTDIRDTNLKRFLTSCGTITAGISTGIELAVHTGYGCPWPFAGPDGLFHVAILVIVPSAVVTCWRTWSDVCRVFEPHDAGPRRPKRPRG